MQTAEPADGRDAADPWSARRPLRPPRLTPCLGGSYSFETRVQRFSAFLRSMSSKYGHDPLLLEEDCDINICAPAWRRSDTDGFVRAGTLNALREVPAGGQQGSPARPSSAGAAVGRGRSPTSPSVGRTAATPEPSRMSHATAGNGEARASPQAGGSQAASEQPAASAPQPAAAAESKAPAAVAPQELAHAPGGWEIMQPQADAAPLRRATAPARSASAEGRPPLPPPAPAAGLPRERAQRRPGGGRGGAAAAVRALHAAAGHRPCDVPEHPAAAGAEDGSGKATVLSERCRVRQERAAKRHAEAMAQLAGPGGRC
eukprot:TRINITY_DN50113_c0_g1_i1.p1 TRINITY_DN50113_c0_g1~~TRINITY_DN50113_c0_g1_i1.p1  ORF type:complete len:341 (+),score=46.46 TRINITY_DN50113_c0_g1_i1:76-1023(+)